MTFKLKSRTGTFPPQGFYFKDPKTGMEFRDGDFNDVVRRIIAHRRANPKLYPPEQFEFLNFESVGAELESYTCSRLGNNSRFCESGEPFTLEPTPGSSSVEMARVCYRCGHNLGYEIPCSTCSGKKVSGYICAKCHAPLGR